MKKIIFSICLAALAVGCTKTEVNYGATDQIAFAPVASNVTKAAVQSGAPGCNLIVSANAGLDGNDTNTTVDISECTELYFNNVEFTGTTAYTAQGYFWPNVKYLTFAGITKSAGVNVEKVTMDVDANSIVITDYPQQPVGTVDNDLMWFASTTPTGKTNNAISVEMKHACSWLVLNFYGDETAGNTVRPWNITKVTLNDLSDKETVTLSDAAVWTTSGTKNQDLVVYENATGIGMQQSTFFTPSINGIIVIPQKPTTISVTYNYLSQGINTTDKTSDDITIEETATVELNFDGTANQSNTWSNWAAGKKYTYDIKLTATGIKIAPTASSWVDYDADGNNTNGNQSIPGTI